MKVLLAKVSNNKPVNMALCKKEQVVGFVERLLKTVFKKLGIFVADHPLPFLIVPIVLTCCLLAGMARYGFKHLCCILIKVLYSWKLNFKLCHSKTCHSYK